MSRTGERVLIFFTNHFPWGVGERWKFEDITAFSPHFDRVHVIPLSCADRLNSYCYPKNVILEAPILPLGQGLRFRPFLALLRTLRSPKFSILAELVRYGMRGERKALAACLYTLQLGQEVIRVCGKRKLFEDPRSTTLFFFWGIGSAAAVPLLRPRFSKIVVGLHGYDLYVERAPYGFFPFRDEMFRCANIIAPCSAAGEEYLRSRHGGIAHKIFVKRLGVEDFGQADPSTDGTLHLLSCAFVSPVKRVEKIVDVLVHCDFDVQWTHIGGGEGLDALRAYAGAKLRNSRAVVNFLGNLSADEVRSYYREHAVDLFISMSSSEGVPVSFMEALSAGVPIVSTRVGGIPELIDDSVGRLVAPDASPEYVAGVLRTLSKLSPSCKHQMRLAASARAEERCRSPKVNASFARQAFASTEMQEQ